MKKKPVAPKITPTVGLTQKRGAWLAKSNDQRSADVLGCEIVPVMRDFNDGLWTWGGAAVDFLAEAGESEDGAWWRKPEHEEWRNLLLEGAPLWVRKAEPASAAHPNGSVGRSIGVFATSAVELGDAQFSLKLTERLATVKA
ncbi:hypothetical protein G5B40_19295 [Pikeienuella piscinae]|uniref:Uncharacterized protein n=1 Tax=Pikeienuella piscinae TaxID=2748098 RepID=A0A7M3T5X0_9RHOB|nr:hypothetical protein [Pikeienuella piscinae]QIE57401.1 hypothetical protein G5B40_19295 [Pikeienuella piscinae]